MKLAPLFSSSSGNCIFARAGGANILVDAGRPCRAITAELESIGMSPKDLSAILVTHDHTDHTAGLGPICRKFKIPIYANGPTWRAISAALGPLPPDCVRTFETGREFSIGGALVYPFPIPHDAAEPVGYSLSSGGRRLTIMTDLGYAAPAAMEAAAGSDLLLIESNHDPDMVRVCSYPYPIKRRILSDYGHLSNEACGKALARLYLKGVRMAVLGHLSRDNNTAALALETVRSELRFEDIPDDSFKLFVAGRDGASGVYGAGEE